MLKALDQNIEFCRKGAYLGKYADYRYCLVCGFPLGMSLADFSFDNCPCCRCKVCYAYDLNGEGAREARKLLMGEILACDRTRQQFGENSHNIPTELL